MVGLVTIDFGTENFALVDGPWKIIGSAATSQILGHLCPQVIAGGNWGVDITLQK